MPSLSQLPGEIKRRKFINALIRCGFEIDCKGGDGSHIKTTWPKTCKSITIPSRLRRDVLYYVLKEIEKYSNITWKDIEEEL